MVRPYDRAWVLGFLAGRAIDGIESVRDGRYRRRVGDAWAEAEFTARGLRVYLPTSADTAEMLERFARLFDLDAPADLIDAGLRRHPELDHPVRKGPGIRVPGFWDPLEGAVRAILGQQVSVARGDDAGVGALRTLRRRRFSERGNARSRRSRRHRHARRTRSGRLDDRGHAWPRKAMPGSRTRTRCAGVSRMSAAWGPWTTEYAAMRVARDPDAFPATDWGVYKALGFKGKAARDWAEPCRPWRAYATMVLWRSRP